MQNHANNDGITGQVSICLYVLWQVLATWPPNKNGCVNNNMATHLIKQEGPPNKERL